MRTLWCVFYLRGTKVKCLVESGMDPSLWLQREAQRLIIDHGFPNPGFENGILRRPGSSVDQLIDCIIRIINGADRLNHGIDRISDAID